MGNLTQRPPIVTVLGHVDHGKTTLLDKIRNTSVQTREAGGITQGIGASVVSRNTRDITFIDTPGHSAFSNMRQQGTKIADIAILVIASTEGVMPQTKEAIEYIKASNTPFIVAATKTDLSSCDVEKVKNDLEKMEIAVEGRGGDVPLVCLSAKNGTGIDELMEMILLVADMNELKADREGEIEAYVFETGKDKRGNYASLVVKNGVLRCNDEIFISGQTSKIRGMFDQANKPVKETLPGYPCQIIGFNFVPKVGSRVWENGKQKENEAQAVSGQKKSSAENGNRGIIIKAANAGSLEAVVSNLPEKINLVDSGVGDITESDIFMAKSTGADIFLFEKKLPASMKKLAESEGVKVFSFDIIYHLFEKLEKDLESDIIKEKGTAKILMEFPFNSQRVAGCKMISGVISKNDKISVSRNETHLSETRAISLKKGKNDIQEVKQGEEFGVIFSPKVEFAIGDMISSLQ